MIDSFSIIHSPILMQETSDALLTANRPEESLIERETNPGPNCSLVNSNDWIQNLVYQVVQSSVEKGTFNQIGRLLDQCIPGDYEMDFSLKEFIVQRMQLLIHMNNDSKQVLNKRLCLGIKLLSPQSIVGLYSTSGTFLWDKVLRNISEVEQLPIPWDQLISGAQNILEKKYAMFVPLYYSIKAQSIYRWSKDPLKGGNKIELTLTDKMNQIGHAIENLLSLDLAPYSSLSLREIKNRSSLQLSNNSLNEENEYSEDVNFLQILITTSYLLTYNNLELNEYFCNLTLQNVKNPKMDNKSVEIMKTWKRQVSAERWEIFIKVNDLFKSEIFHSCSPVLTVHVDLLYKNLTHMLKAAKDYNNQYEKSTNGGRLCCKDHSLEYLLEWLNRTILIFQNFQKYSRRRFLDLDRRINGLLWCQIYLITTDLKKLIEFKRQLGQLNSKDLYPFLIEKMESLYGYQYDPDQFMIELKKIDQSKFESESLFETIVQWVSNFGKKRIHIRDLHGSIEGAFFPSLPATHRVLRSLILDLIESNHLPKADELPAWLNSAEEKAKSKPSLTVQRKKKKKKQNSKQVKSCTASPPQSLEVKTQPLSLANLPPIEEATVVSSPSLLVTIVDSSRLAMTCLEKLKKLLVSVGVPLDHPELTGIQAHFDNALFHINLLKAYPRLLMNLVPQDRLCSEVLAYSLCHLSLEQTLRGVECFQNGDDPMLWRSILKSSRHHLPTLWDQCYLKGNHAIAQAKNLKDNALGSVWIRYPYTMKHPIQHKLKDMHQDYLLFLRNSQNGLTWLSNRKISICYKSAHSLVQQFVPLLHHLISVLSPKFIEPIDSNHLIDSQLKEMILLIEDLTSRLIQQDELKKGYLKNASFHLAILHSLISLASRDIDPVLEGLVSFKMLFFLNLALEQLLIAQGDHQIDPIVRAPESQGHNLAKLAERYVKKGVLSGKEENLLKQYSEMLTQMRYPFYNHTNYHKELNQFLLAVANQISIHGNSPFAPVKVSKETMTLEEIQKVNASQQAMKQLVMNTLNLQKEITQIVPISI